MRRLVVLLPCALSALLGGCETAPEMRALVIATDAQWRDGAMTEGSFEGMLACVQNLGRQSSDDEARIAAVPELLRVALGDPSSFVRAESLRSAWKLVADLPAAEAWRVDPLARDEFNQRTLRLEELLAAEGAATDPETLDLSHWLAHFHAPIEQPRLAVSVSEVVTSNALWRKDALGEVFRTELASSLRHALALATLHAAGDPYPVVREEALASARYLHPTTALNLLSGVLARETDSAVMLAALDSLQAQAGQLPSADLRAVLEPLQGSTDVAVRQRIRDLLALAS